MNRGADRARRFRRWIIGIAGSAVGGVIGRKLGGALAREYRMTKRAPDVFGMEMAQRESELKPNGKKGERCPL